MKNLFEVSADEYPDIREQMVHHLVDIDLDAPLDTKLAMLDELVTLLYENMDDDSLQFHYDATFEDGEEADTFHNDIFEVEE